MIGAGVGRDRIALVALALAGAMAHPASAEEPERMTAEAREHLDRGLAAYGRREYAAAAEEFRRGYATDPHPEFLFPWAQALRLSGDCAGALPIYRRVLQVARNPGDRREVEQLIEGCEKIVARRQPAPPPERETARAERSPDPPPEAATVELGAPEPVPPSPWYRDPWGGALAGSGVVAVGVGAALMVAGNRSERDADAAPSLDQFIDASDLATRRYRLGTLAATAGGALIVAGIVRYVVVGHGEHRDSPAAALRVAPSAGGVTLGVATRF